MEQRSAEMKAFAPKTAQADKQKHRWEFGQSVYVCVSKSWARNARADTRLAVFRWDVGMDGLSGLCPSSAHADCHRLATMEAAGIAKSQVCRQLNSEGWGN